MSVGVSSMNRNRIRALREEIGMTQRELANRLGVANGGMISKYENGLIPLSEANLRMLSLIFDASVDYILGLSDDKKRGSSLSPASLAWDAAVLVEGADALPKEQRQLLFGFVRDPEALALAGRFLRLSGKSRRRVLEYMDLLKMAEESKDEGK